ncbi:MAG: hypothetical protein ABI693_17940 [Bryobacteraceae bacterium]
MRTTKLLHSQRILVVLLGLGVGHASLSSSLLCQTPAFSINPGKLELEVNSGTERTAAFEVAAAAASVPERGRIMVSPTDWTILEDGSLTFGPPGSSKEQSASSWIAFSPSAFTLEAARIQLVRITVTVPEGTPPGVYRTGLFVQERPSATPPEPGLRVINVRVRYVFLLYVMVPPISSHAQLVNVEADTSNGPPRLICELKNTGNRHARPLVFWSIRRRGSAEAEARGKVEATVLLPESTMREAYSLQHLTLAPGLYQVLVFLDFQDGQPQQSMSRDFEVPGSPAPTY